MATKIENPIKIALFGLDERSTVRMTTIFRINYKGRCEIAQGENASLAIVDIDETNAWEKFQHLYSHLPAIMISETPKEVAGTTCVTKPVNLDLLWNSIFNLVTTCSQVGESADKTNTTKSPLSGDISAAPPKLDCINSTVNNTAQAIDTQFKTTRNASKTVQRGEHQDTTSRFYEPDDYLLGHILSALKTSTSKHDVIHVQCWRDRRLILLPDQGLAFTDLTDSQLKNLGTATINDTFAVKIKIKNEKLSISETKGLKSINIDYLLWDLALRTARGRVPEGTDFSMPLYLQCWPNFTRRHVHPMICVLPPCG